MKQDIENGYPIARTSIECKGLTLPPIEELLITFCTRPMGNKRIEMFINFSNRSTDECCSVEFLHQCLPVELITAHDSVNLYGLIASNSINDYIGNLIAWNIGNSAKLVIEYVLGQVLMIQFTLKIRGNLITESVPYHKIAHLIPVGQSV